MNRVWPCVMVLAATLFSSASLLAWERQERPSPVTPVIASSIYKPTHGTNTYEAPRVFDGKSDTAWCEGVEGVGVGQWVAVYLGDAALMGGPQDFVLHVNRGITRDYESYMYNGRPTRLRVELFADSKLLASAEGALEHAFGEVKVRNVPAATGDLWMKVTILAVTGGDREQDTCIGELRPSFEKANPSNVREFAQRICLMINEPKTYETNKDLKALVAKIRKYFVSQEEGGAPRCEMEFFQVISATEFELHGAASGDGTSILRFRKSGIVWDLLSVGDFTLFE